MLDAPRFCIAFRSSKERPSFRLYSSQLRTALANRSRYSVSCSSAATLSGLRSNSTFLIVP